MVMILIVTFFLCWALWGISKVKFRKEGIKKECRFCNKKFSAHPIFESEHCSITCAYEETCRDFNLKMLEEENKMIEIENFAEALYWKYRKDERTWIDLPKEEKSEWFGQSEYFLRTIRSQ